MYILYRNELQSFWRFIVSLLVIGIKCFFIFFKIFFYRVIFFRSRVVFFFVKLFVFLANFARPVLREKKMFPEQTNGSMDFARQQSAHGQRQNVSRPCVKVSQTIYM